MEDIDGEKTEKKFADTTGGSGKDTPVYTLVEAARKSRSETNDRERERRKR